MPTTSDDVRWMVDKIRSLGADPIIAGGWGIDALLGRQSRDHRDLDVLLDDAAVSPVVEALQKERFMVTTDWLPVRIELSETEKDRHIDLHPLFDDGFQGFWQHGLDGARFDYPAEVITTGTIDGHVVRCLSAAKQIELHSGYDFREVDHHDIAILSLVTSSSDHE